MTEVDSLIVSNAIIAKKGVKSLSLDIHVNSIQNLNVCIQMTV